jgi:serine/threonine protein kinase
MWSIGCIFAELITLQPLFPGDSEIDELYRIFRTLGTPNEESWPGVSELPDFQAQFPIWPGTSLNKIIPNADPQAIDLLTQMLLYDPSRRISAKQALKHPYFDDIRTANW